MKKSAKFSFNFEDSLSSLNFPNSTKSRLKRKLCVSAIQNYLNCSYSSNIFRFIQTQKSDNFLGHPVEHGVIPKGAVVIAKVMNPTVTDKRKRWQTRDGLSFM